MNNINTKTYTEYITNTISNLVKPFNDNLRKSNIKYADESSEDNINIIIDEWWNINILKIYYKFF